MSDVLTALCRQRERDFNRPTPGICTTGDVLSPPSIMTPLSDLWLKRTTPLTSHTHDVMRVLTPFGVYSVESREQTDAERDESQSQRVRDTESETKEDGGENTPRRRAQGMSQSCTSDVMLSPDQPAYIPVYCTRSMDMCSVSGLSTVTAKTMCQATYSTASLL